MKERDFQAGLNQLDCSLVERHLKDIQRLEGERRSRKLRLVALAACFCLVLGSVLTLPLLREEPQGAFSDNSADTSSAELDNPNDPPAVGSVILGDAVTGTQSVTVGRTEIGEAALDMAYPYFPVGIIVEACVVEVLPDVYVDSGGTRTYWVAKLKILDVIRGENLPETIYFRFRYQEPPFYQIPGKTYERDLFDGYSSMILSLEQEGIENYMLINKDQGRAEYFPDMFCLDGVDLPDYGSIIPFVERRATYDLWDMIPHPCPAKIGDSVEQVKKKVRDMIAEEDGYLPPCRYVTAEDVFVTEEGKEIRRLVASQNGNVFAHRLLFGGDEPVVQYHRLVNGVPTEEWIAVTPGKVTRSQIQFTREELEALPDIGTAVATLDVSKLAPPHVSLLEGDRLQGYNVQGFYRVADGEIYGILRVIWVYRRKAEGYLQDDCYFLYDCHGNARTVEREELRELLGDDILIGRFSYEPFMVCI